VSFIDTRRSIEQAWCRTIKVHAYYIYQLVMWLLACLGIAGPLFDVAKWLKIG